ncbi:MAG: hypothetical protein AAFX54_10580 [Pseudomonadota bacterium]
MTSIKKPIHRYIYDSHSFEMKKLSHADYTSEFHIKGPDEIRASNPITKAAFEKAWEIRNIEVELYWKRATYFWAFIASAFAAYLALISRNPEHLRSPIPEEEFYIICVGFVLSVAWLLINRGSKSWQRHWEAHVDLLEDEFTGPLYKTVRHNISFSVSKLNEIISAVFVAVWILFGVQFLVENELINYEFHSVRWGLCASSIITLIATIAMFVGHGRGRFGRQTITMYRREYDFADVDGSTP